MTTVGGAVQLPCTSNQGSTDSCNGSRPQSVLLMVHQHKYAVVTCGWSSLESILRPTGSILAPIYTHPVNTASRAC